MTQTQLTTELVHDLVVEPIPTLDICAKHELNLTQLRELLESDEFTHLLTEFEAVDRLRIPIFRRRAINALEYIMLQQPTGSTHAETIRKAAVLYLRTTTPPPDPATTEPAEPSDQSQPVPDARTTPQHHAPAFPQAIDPAHPPSPIPDPSSAPATLINAAGQPTAHHPPPTANARRSA